MIDAEWVLLDNFMMDLIIFALVLRFSEKRIRWPRAIAAAAAGAAYALAALLFPPASALPCKAVASLFLCRVLCPFRPARSFGRTLLLFYGISFVLGGAVLAAMLLCGDAPVSGAFLNWPVLRYLLIGGVGGVVLVDQIARRQYPQRGRTYLVQGVLLGESFSLTGFVDTGNLLQDPMGRSVIVADREALLRQLSGALRRRLQAGDPSLPSVPIPISTVMGKGELYAFLPDELLLCREGRRWRVKAYLALSDGAAGPGHSAILGERLTLIAEK